MGTLSVNAPDCGVILLRQLFAFSTTEHADRDIAIHSTDYNDLQREIPVKAVFGNNERRLLVS